MLGALLAIGGAAHLLIVIAVVNHLDVLGGVPGERVGFDSREQVKDAGNFLVSTGIFWLLVTLVIAVVFVVWTWRAAKNNETLGRDHPRLGPEWAIAGWLIPLAGFVMPVLVVQDLWRGSTARIPRGDMRWRIADRSALVGWWWAGWIATLFGGFGALFGTDSDRSRVADLRAGDSLTLVGGLFGIAAAVLAILVVRAVTRRQEATLVAQQAAWSAAHRE